MREFPVIVGRSLLYATAAFIVSFMVSCGGLTAYYERKYPHDGQTGLAAFIFATPVAIAIAILAPVVCLNHVKP